MSEEHFSRRNFLSTLAATGALATTQLSPFSGLAHAGATNVDKIVKRPDEPIRIVCLQQLSAAERQEIQGGASNVELIMLSDPDNSKQIAEAEAIIGMLNGPEVLRAKKLKWMQTLAAGVKDMSPELIHHPCILTNMQRVFAPVIAESAIGLLLSLTRGLAQVSIPALKEQKWMQAPEDIVLDDLYGKTIGIVGMGGIGSETARRLHYGFNMRVLGTDAKPLPRPEYVAELHDPGWLMEMVPQVDVLMSAAPLTKETKLMFNKAVFGRMKPSAYFINMSRGGLVDNAALVSALKERKIRGAGLDVTTPEPLPAGHPLWTCPNIVITPHNSTQAAIRQKRQIALVAENVRRYSQGLPLMNVVDKVAGY